MDPTIIDLSVRTGQFISPDSEIPPDITFKFTKSGDDEVFAHKMYLAMVSRVFRNMFFVCKTQDRIANVIVMEDTTKPPFQVMIHALYNFKPLKESLTGMSIDEIFAVLYLVTKYEIPELVLAVKEGLSAFHISEDNVLEVANDAMEYTSTFEEDAQGIIFSCAKFLHSTLTATESPFQSFLEFVAKNGDRMATVHKLAVIMKDLPCPGCHMKFTECQNGMDVKATNVMVGAKVRRNPRAPGRENESHGVGVIVRKDERTVNKWVVRWENNLENVWQIDSGGLLLFV